MRPFALMLTLTLATFGCNRERATADTCAAIADRIVELELSEQGFRDPALLARKGLEMRRLLAADLRRCAGRRLRRDAVACVNAARNAEAISHVCLR